MGRSEKTFLRLSFSDNLKLGLELGTFIIYSHATFFCLFPRRNLSGLWVASSTFTPYHRLGCFSSTKGG